MSNQSLSERAAIKLNELGLTEIKAKHIPFLAIILLIIVLGIRELKKLRNVIRIIKSLI